MEAHGFALAVCFPLFLVMESLLANDFLEEFAYLEISYTIARLIQLYPAIEVARGERFAKPGDEKQTLTLVVSSAEGCKVKLSSE